MVLGAFRGDGGARCGELTLSARCGAALLSSRLLEVESHATVARRGGSHADVDAIVSRVDLDDVDDEVIEHALSLRSGLRAMDALHLSTALLYGEALTVFATFDHELADAAQKFGLDPSPELI